MRIQIGNSIFRPINKWCLIRKFSETRRPLIYTDGSYIHNKNGIGNGGIGIHFAGKEYQDISENYSLWFDPLKNPPTSNRCELLAVYRTFSICLAHKMTAEIHTDSEYVINSIVYYAPRWNANGWYRLDGTPVKNIDLILPLYLVYSRLDGNFVFKHVKAHEIDKVRNTNCPNVDKHKIGNLIADKLAKQGAKKQ